MLSELKKFHENVHEIRGLCREVDRRLEGYCPERKRIIRELRDIATTVEDTNHGTAIGRIVGSSVGVGGQGASILGGGLVIAATGGIAAPIILGLGLALGVLGTTTNVVSKFVNDQTKEKSLKKIKALIEKDKEAYEFIRDKLEELDSLMSKTATIFERLLTAIQKQIVSIWNDVKSEFQELMVAITKRLHIDVNPEKRAKVAHVARTVSSTALTVGRGVAALTGEVIDGGAKFASVGIKIAATATIVFSAIGIGIDVYQLASGVGALGDTADAEKIREIADDLEKFYGDQSYF